MRKCDFCDEEATQVTTLYASGESGLENSERHVCLRHFLEFEHGIVTIECTSCKLPTLLDNDHYYHLNQIFCAHCGQSMENKEWIHRIKTTTYEEND